MKTIFATFALALIGSVHPHAAEKPNILLILVDDLKPALGCYGDPHAKTPNIDKLAARGIRFDLAYCNQAVCAPSRFTLMLGSHSTSTGLYSLGSNLRKSIPDAVTLPQHFAKHGGYHTESLGKIFHIGHGNLGDPDSFSVPHFKEKVIEYVDPTSKPEGKLTREEAMFDNVKAPAAGMNSLPRGAAFESPNVEDNAYADGRVATETIKRLEAAKKRRTTDGTPFFIAAGFARPHLPFSAPKKYWDLYDPAKLPLAQNKDLPTNSPKVAHKRGGEIRNYFPVPDKDNPAQINDTLARQLIHGYYASVSYVDAQIGKVIDELDTLGLTENTIIVLWGDHGFHLGDLGIWTKHTNYEQANRIPILISAPGITKPNTHTKQLTESVDIFPTLAELAGLPAPTGPQPVDGVSLVPVLKDPSTRVRDHAYHAYPKSKLGRAIRTERYRLVEWGDEYELYDYQTDPLETENLATKNPETLAELKTILARHPAPFGSKPNKPAAVETPQIKNREITLTAKVRAKSPHGVVLAQGGREHGYALHFIKGVPTLDVRINGTVTRLPATEVASGEIELNATITDSELTLTVNEETRTITKSPGLIPVQPKDGLSIGHDDLSAAGDYPDDNPFNGKVISHQINTGKQASTDADPTSITTEWASQVTATNAWQEYPRPQFIRDQWTNLNGLWNYAITDQTAARPTQWIGQILVPFAIESTLSGVKKRITPEDALWYERSFEHQPTANTKTILNFEAVDYHSTVWINDQQIGTHTGGNLPFNFDITHALNPGSNTLTVRVTDATDTAFQLHGKQVSNPRGIWYTPVSGIWQTVWLETVTDTHLTSFKATTKVDGTVHFEFNSTGKADILVTVSLDGNQVAKSDGSPLTIPNPKLWSPDSPTLYDLEIRYGQDHVKSYIGIRETTIAKDEQGHLRFLLNGEPIFHWGTLDQGWWPDGLLTPPSDAAMLSDIAFLKAAGFNTIRKHIKVEPRRYYTHCDQIGMLVWQDQVSSGVGNPDSRQKVSAPWTRLDPNPIDAQWPDAAHAQYMIELETMINSLHNHPAIVQWVPFNEAWGQHRTTEVGQWTTNFDPTRQINVASGGNFFPVGHIVDHHQYPHPGFPFDLGAGGRFDHFVKVVGEFGGHGFPVEGHLWNPNAKNWGYGGLPKDKDEWIDRYKTSLNMLVELKEKGIAAGIYTQTTDVEGEINGLITYDRKVQKLPPATLKKLVDDSGLLSTPKSKKTNTDINSPLNIPDATVAPVTPVMTRAEIEAGLKSHDRALFIKNDWIRDPYITLGPDDFYYLTGTTINEDDPREETDPYNIGLGAQSAVGSTVRVWQSKDLIDWQYLGPIFSTNDSFHKNPGKRIWAPEIHWLPEQNRWALVHCPKQKANLAFTANSELQGPWIHPMGQNLGQKHDPSLFHSGDHWWMLSENTHVQAIADDFSKFTSPATRIDPSSSRQGSDGKPITRIGHEGATMMKVGEQFVHLGTAWSTDGLRTGSYNLYYSVANKITGPYGPRKFAGRFLGHGTPFQTRDGKWWCTAFFNANVPPLSRTGIQSRDLSETAQTINGRGTTIVPLDVRVLSNGDIHIRAKDPDYANPGPDEAQKDFSD